MNWRAETMIAAEQQIIHFRILDGDSAVSYARVIELWQQADPGFTNYFVELLKSCPFEAFCWETPAITHETAQQNFEFVLVNSPGLARPVDRAAFQSFFDSDLRVVEFINLGRDATLVAPTPLTQQSEPIQADAYFGHLASFVRNADTHHIQELWSAVGSACVRRLAHQPFWLSTAGMGISWLHVRLDDRPKYYRYSPYREIQ